MRIEGMIELSVDLLPDLYWRTEGEQGRSSIVEAALRAYLAAPNPSENARDLAIINAHAMELNEEAADVLEYQIVP